ncbi:hypothetical protein ACLB2K_030871 [Fragaria x ananassa]
MSRASLRPEDTWKLVLFPNGNKDRGVEDYISLYLKMGGNDAIKPVKIVTIDYKLFLLYRHNGKEKYRVLEEPNKKYCFYKTIVGCLAGFDLFIPLDLFRDTSEGYLIDDRYELPPGSKILAGFTLRILDQIHGNHCSYKAAKACWFDAANPNFGRQQMITQEENARFSMDDSCIIVVEVTIQGVLLCQESRFIVSCSRIRFIIIHASLNG